MTKKSERTRQRIVESANRLFYHQGYNRTSFSDVVEAANVPRGNIYYYFKTKDEILQAALAYRKERIRQMLDGWTDSYRTPVERLHRFVAILGDSADSLLGYGCPMGSLNTELGKGQRDLQVQAEQLFHLFESWLSDQFAELGYAGRALELSQRLMAMGQGISVMAHVHRDGTFLKNEQRRMEEWIDRLADGDDSCI